MKIYLPSEATLKLLLWLSLQSACTSPLLEMRMSQEERAPSSPTQAMDPHTDDSAIIQAAKALMALHSPAAKQSLKLERALDSLLALKKDKKVKKRSCMSLDKLKQKLLLDYRKGAINELGYKFYPQAKDNCHVLVIAIAESLELSLVQVLLELGAEVKKADDPKTNTRHPLNHLVMDNQLLPFESKLAMLRCLVDKGLDINRQDLLGNTLLHKYCHKSQIPQLLKHFPEITESLYIQNEDGKLPWEIYSLPWEADYKTALLLITSMNFVRASEKVVQWKMLRREVTPLDKAIEFVAKLYPHLEGDREFFSDLLLLITLK